MYENSFYLKSIQIVCLLKFFYWYVRNIIFKSRMQYIFSTICFEWKSFKIFKVWFIAENHLSL